LPAKIIFGYPKGTLYRTNFVTIPIQKNLKREDISKISIENHSVICTLRDEAYLLAQIGKKLDCPKTSMFNVLKKKKEIGLIINKQRFKRKRVTSASKDTFITLNSKGNRHLTSVDITKIVNISRTIKLSVTTDKRRLQEADLNDRITARK